MYEKSFHLIIKSQHNTTLLLTFIYTQHKYYEEMFKHFKIEFPIQFTQTLHV